MSKRRADPQEEKTQVELPLDVWGEVASAAVRHLSGFGDLRRLFGLLSINKTWRDELNIFQRVEYVDNYLLSQLDACHIEKFTGVKHLIVPFYFNKMTHYISSLKQLETLDLSLSRDLQPTDFGSCAKKLIIGPSGPRFKRNPSSKNLSRQYPDLECMVDFGHMPYTFNGFTKLKELRLSAAFGRDHEIYSLKTLEVLYISTKDHSPSMASDWIYTLPNLKELYPGYGMDMNESAIAAFRERISRPCVF